MKWIYTIALVGIVAGGIALAQSSTSGTASGSSAPNQLGTPLNGQTNTGTLETPTATTNGSPDMFGSDFANGPNGLYTFPNSPTYTTPPAGAYSVTPPNPAAPIQGYALPVIPTQPMQPNNGDTVSGTTMEPQWAPSPTATPTTTP